MVPVEDSPPLARSLWPLPGGRGSYVSTLETITDKAATAGHVDDLVAFLLERFPQVTSTKTARSYLHVPADLGFINFEFGGAISQTAQGRRLVRTGDPLLVRDALFTRIAGVWELVDLLRAQPRRIGLLVQPMRDAGFEWKTDRQIRYRLRWLEEAGVVSPAGKAYVVYSVTGKLPRRKR